MDDIATDILRRTIRKIPVKKLQDTLKSWEHISTSQLETLDFSQPKWVFLENLRSLCEENDLNVKHVTELEMIYHIRNPNQGTWHACQLLEAEDEALSVELTQFREQFKAHLMEVMRHVSVKIKKHEDQAIWIRIAWGDNFNKPNQLKPTYVVHYLQTPYVFVSKLSSKHKPYLYQALVLSTRHSSIKDAHLSGSSLIALRDLLMRQYQQVFPTNQSRPLQERNALPSHPNIGKEHAELAEKRLQMACEAFGDGTVPKLETAVYRLETKYKGNGNDTLIDRDEPFKGVVQFTSTNLLESLRHCVASGMADAPVTPLLSSITQKGRNYFVITEKGPGAASQMTGRKI
ncbi:centromere protein N [Chanos chanos]|uniref:Centromere protein N n=1 Tax=Chanos chanos TaxID=29144 RepID=A0A6J2X0L2_CHACN|nr:centromere protein N [Chanos chanos]